MPKITYEVELSITLDTDSATKNDYGYMTEAEAEKLLKNAVQINVKAKSKDKRFKVTKLGKPYIIGM
jgi:hypothetical protein